MRFAYLITKAVDTHSGYVVLIAFFTATTVLRKQLNVKLQYVAFFYVFSTVHHSIKLFH